MHEPLFDFYPHYLMEVWIYVTYPLLQLRQLFSYTLRFQDLHQVKQQQLLQKQTCKTKKK